MVMTVLLAQIPIPVEKVVEKVVYQEVPVQQVVEKVVVKEVVNLNV